MAVKLVKASTRTPATLLGDLVGSREREDRRELQRTLRRVLKRANSFLAPVWPLEATVGDEFQGGFASISEAAWAGLVVRLALLQEADIDSRYGIGLGEVAVLHSRKAPRSQDGPGWWAARDAIVQAEMMATEPRTSFVRTCFRLDPRAGESSALESSLQAFLLCRDAEVDRMNDRGRRLLLGILLGIPQSELAYQEGITQGGVSQHLKRSGAFAIEAAHKCLNQEPQWSS